MNLINSTWVPVPAPLEVTDPELATHFREIANRNHPVVGIFQTPQVIVLTLKNGKRKVIRL